MQGNSPPTHQIPRPFTCHHIANAEMQGGGGGGMGGGSLKILLFVLPHNYSSCHLRMIYPQYIPSWGQAKSHQHGVKDPIGKND
jgi:hypothetical protein